ncbi:hypothetical protein N9N03_00700 [Chlamydiia bacterium]|nr:hypothetical protein [Chlamydiia bacterium]
MSILNTFILELPYLIDIRKAYFFVNNECLNDPKLVTFITPVLLT